MADPKQSRRNRLESDNRALSALVEPEAQTQALRNERPKLVGRRYQRPQGAQKIISQGLSVQGKSHPGTITATRYTGLHLAGAGADPRQAVRACQLSANRPLHTIALRLPQRQPGHDSVTPPLRR